VLGQRLGRLEKSVKLIGLINCYKEVIKLTQLVRQSCLILASKEGQAVQAGQVLFELNTIAANEVQRLQQILEAEPKA